MPFIDYQDELRKLGPVAQRNAMGASNWRLVESGLAKWEDVVTKGRVRDFREVADRLNLSVDRMVKAGVRPDLARRAYDATHTEAHAATAKDRDALIKGLKAHGVKDERIAAEVGQLLAGRVGVIGPGGSASGISPPPAPKPPKPTPAKVAAMPSAKPKPAKPKPGPADDDLFFVPPASKPVAGPKPVSHVGKPPSAPKPSPKPDEGMFIAAPYSAPPEPPKPKPSPASAPKVEPPKPITPAPAVPTPKPGGWTPTPADRFRKFTKIGDMERWGERASHDWNLFLTPDDRSNIDYYSANGYTYMNLALRDPADARKLLGPADFAEMQRRNAATAKVLARGVTPDAVVAYRGVKDVGKLGIDPANLVPGSVMTDDGFASVSLSRDVANGFATGMGSVNPVVFEVRMPAGSTGAYLNAGGLSQSSNEREFLCPPGSEFRVVGRGKDTPEGARVVIVERVK